MKLQDFAELRNFQVSEKDIYDKLITEGLEKINLTLMLRLDEAVGFAKQEFGKNNGKFIVHCIMAGKHSKNSYHYKGEAVDGHFAGLDLLQQVFIGFKAGFKGIGYYPHWNSKGVHFDIRDQAHVSTWFRLNDSEYVYDYDAFIDRLQIEGNSV